MQLIEIVQLALISFIVLIIIIFFISYMGYKTRKRIRGNSTAGKNNLDTIISDSIIELKSEPKDSSDKIIDKDTKPGRFQVFNPTLSNTNKKKPPENKKHFPRTLFIKR